MTPHDAPVDSAPEWRDAWGDALRSLELDVEAAEELMRSLHAGADELPRDLPFATWTTPRVSGPVPAELADRAQALLRRQMEVTERLAEAMGRTRSQRRALAKLDRAEHRPAFFDRAL